jgi:cytidylate kinase
MTSESSNNKFQAVIAIDGPSGSGKSTMAAKLAKNLGLLYIDTGAMFRALGYWAEKSHVDLSDAPAVDHFLKDLSLEYGRSEKHLISINAEVLDERIRDHHVSSLASIISQIPRVRQYLLEFQRTLVTDQTCVMEGRDIGTVVFPESFCKIFITASAEIRATRRHQQLISLGNTDTGFEQVLEDVLKRDELDTNRKIAPLKVADDATLVDTSDMSESQVLDTLSKIAKSAAQEKNVRL